MIETGYSLLTGSLFRGQPGPQSGNVGPYFSDRMYANRSLTC